LPDAARFGVTVTHLPAVERRRACGALRSHRRARGQPDRRHPRSRNGASRDRVL